MSLPRGVILGQAASTVGSGVGTWAASKAAVSHGAEGERKTEAIINTWANQLGGPTILHDLSIPQNGNTANLDHVIVSGDVVLIIDSKQWAPGFYWTAGGKSRRGLKPTPHVDSKNCQTGARVYRELLAARGITATVLTPVIVVWPSSTKTNMSLWAIKNSGVRFMKGGALGRLRRSLPRTGTANPRIIEALTPLVAGLQSTSVVTPTIGEVAQTSFTALTDNLDSDTTITYPGMSEF